MSLIIFLNFILLTLIQYMYIICTYIAPFFKIIFNIHIIFISFYIIFKFSFSFLFHFYISFSFSFYFIISFHFHLLYSHDDLLDNSTEVAVGQKSSFRFPNLFFHISFYFIFISFSFSFSISFSFLHSFYLSYSF